MNENYLITGLPRSRTAWLANFLTYQDSFCFHEASNGCYSWLDYRKKLNRLSDFRYVGNADSGIGISPMLKAMSEQMPVVIIDRDKDEVIESLYVLFGKNSEIDRLIKRATLNLNQIDSALRIPFNEINSRLEEIWRYCLPMVDFNAERAEQLTRMNIQTTEIWGDPMSINFLLEGVT